MIRDPFDCFDAFEPPKRPEPVRCRKCGGFVYGPIIGESASLVRRVKRSDQAAPENNVAACQRCGNLWELRTERAA